MSPHETLLQRLRASADSATDVEARYFPASFDPLEPDPTVHGRPLDWVWVSAENILRHFGSHGIMMRLPLFWQLETPLFKAGERVGAFIFVNDAANMPLGAAAVRAAEIDIVVTHIQDAGVFATYLRAQNTQGRAWYVIHPLSNVIAPLPPILGGAKVAQEVHLFPGLPVLVQCGSLVDGKAARFHIADDLEHTHDGEQLLVSGAKDDLVPLEHYPLPIRMKDDGTCSCGKHIYSAT